MDFYGVLDQAGDLLRQRGRVTYAPSSSNSNSTMTSWRRSKTNSSTRIPS